MKVRGALVFLALLTGGCPNTPPGTPPPAALGGSPSVIAPKASAIPPQRSEPLATAAPEPAATRSPKRSPVPAAAGPTPDRSPTPSSPTDLAGLWSGRRIALELERGEAGYRGTLTLRKRALPIVIERRPEGWGGVLVQGTQKADFTLAREGAALIMTSDGRSYRLERVEEEDSWVGSYQGPRETTLRVAHGAQGYTGSLDLDGVRYVLSGRLAAGELAGSLRDPLTGKSLTWRASEVEATSVLFTIRLEDQEGDGRASFHALRFERSD